MFIKIMLIDAARRVGAVVCGGALLWQVAENACPGEAEVVITSPRPVWSCRSTAAIARSTSPPASRSAGRSGPVGISW